MTKMIDGGVQFLDITMEEFAESFWEIALIYYKQTGKLLNPMNVENSYDPDCKCSNCLQILNKASVVPDPST